MHVHAPTLRRDRHWISAPTLPAAPGGDFSSLLLSSLELSDTKVYEPCIRALLGTASQAVSGLRVWGFNYKD